MLQVHSLRCRSEDDVTQRCADTLPLLVPGPPLSASDIAEIARVISALDLK